MTQRRRMNGRLRHTQPAWALLGLSQRSTTGSLAHALHDYGFGSIPVFTQEQLLLRLDHPPAHDFAVVVLDRRLPPAQPDSDGIDAVVGAIHDRSDAAIVALTETPLAGVDVDVTLPFDAPAEAVAASASILAVECRRSGASARWGPLHLDISTWEAYWQMTPLELTAQQFRLLSVLVEARGAAVSAQQLARSLYGRALDGDSDPIRAHVGRLRRRLRATAPEAADLVRTVRTRGYRLSR